MGEPDTNPHPDHRRVSSPLLGPGIIDRLAMKNAQPATDSRFIRRLAQGPLLADGGVGTELLRRGNLRIESCLEQLNLTSPELVRSVHLDYIEAGAELIETNTYGANRVRLEHHGLVDSVEEINRRAVEIAQEAQRLTGPHVWIAGAVGPLGKSLAPLGPISLSQARETFREQVQALTNAGVDLLILETFTGLAEVQEAIAAASSVGSLPIIALLTFTEEGVTPAGETPAEVASALSALGVSTLGANCSVGPVPMLRVMEEMALHTTVPLTTMPNAGFPTYVDGRFVYLSSPAYMAQHAGRLLEGGATIIGGCCGTTPEHIGAMREAIRKRRPPRSRARLEAKTASGSEHVQPLLTAPAEPTQLAQKVGKQFTVTVEVDPPRGYDASTIFAELRSLLGTVHVDAFNVSDNPRARGRMSALAMSTLIQTRLGVEAVLHIATRHRNLLALHSDLLGAHGLGVRNVFVVMGDLPYIGDYPQATVVADVTPSGLMAIIHKANVGLDIAGHSTQQATSFFVGCAFNMGATDLDRELRGLERKLNAGADFILTQAVFDPQLVEECHRRLGGFPAPLLMGLLPLSSARHAEFLHNEVPGIVIPPEVQKRMRSAGRRGQQEGVALARELLQAVSSKIDGVYIIPAFGRYQTVAQVLDGLSALVTPEATA